MWPDRFKELNWLYGANVYKAPWKTWSGIWLTGFPDLKVNKKDHLLSDSGILRYFRDLRKRDVTKSMGIEGNV